MMMKRTLAILLAVCLAMGSACAWAEAVPKAVKLSHTRATLSCNRTLQLRATVTPQATLTWTSSNETVATVDETGLVTAGRVKGTAVIRARAEGGGAAACLLTVKRVAVKSVAIPQSSAAMQPGDTLTLTARVLPINASDYTPVWASDNPEVCTVENGMVTALAAGVAVITATAGGKKDACRITVRSEQAASVTITAVGDVTIGGDPRKSASTVGSEGFYEKLYQDYGGKFFKNVKSHFKGLTIVNLESNFTTSKVYQNKKYIFRASPAYASILSSAGVNVVGHANNHCKDFANAVQTTRSSVRSHEMAYVGNGNTAIITKNGVTVGFCAFMAMSVTSGITNSVRNTVKTLSTKCDVVVVSLHWGQEYAYAASVAQRNLGRAAVSAGADLVVGHHSHVVGGIELFKGRCIAYSLGTFSSPILTPDDMDTFIFSQQFEVEAGTVTPGAVEVTACSMSSRANVNDGMPQVLTGSDRTRVVNKIKRYSQAFPATPEF